jgi:GNAT superfamily N-acetyltransferase
VTKLNPIIDKDEITIVAYHPNYRSHFKSLNKEWIDVYFKMEESDNKALDHPEEYILNPGGHILVAIHKETPVGVCALIKMDAPEFDFELAKMAVAPSARGLGIGWKLGKAVIEKAKSLGAKNIYLESNTVLAPAINLYYKLGFKKVHGVPTPYERCNIQMAMELV